MTSIDDGYMHCVIINSNKIKNIFVQGYLLSFNSWISSSFPVLVLFFIFDDADCDDDDWDCCDAAMTDVVYPTIPSDDIPAVAPS